MKPIQDTYNKDYYDNYINTEDYDAYDRKNKQWLELFQRIAKHIVKDFNPKTVLDVGCAKGFLVEALRDLGIEAYGIDVSEYAISQVREDIRPYCKVASADQPFDKQYDLIVSIEVLEHIEKKFIPAIVENLCKHTNKVLFSSTPSDFHDVTHVNVQPSEYWVEQFFNNGFIRQLDYDASYIANATMLLTKSNLPISLIIKNYERNFYRVYDEKTELRKELERVIDESHHNKKLVKPLQDINKEYERINKEYEVMHKSDLEKIQYVEEKIQLLQQLNDELKLANDTLRIEKENLIQNLSNLEEEKESYIQNLSNLEEERENYIQNLSSLEEEKESFIQHLSSLEEEKEEQTLLAHERMLIINDIRNKMHIMENTKGWRLLNKVRNTRNIILSMPRQTKKIVALPGKFYTNYKTYGLKSTLAKTKRFIKNGGYLIETQEITIEEQLKRKRFIINCKKEVKTFKYNPLISFIVPVFNTPIDVLKETIECVKDQIYENWELCLINASKDNEAVCKVLEDYAQKDKRIQIIVLEENKGISENSNVGLQKAHGEFIALLDHDDLIVEEALYEVVKRLQEPDNEYDFFYSDKDMMSADGTKFYNPLHKPSWSLEMLYSANYITHFDVIRKSLMIDVGGFDPTTDGAQDWDMFLKIGEVARQVCHIPKVLYHWRMIETSAASGIEAKPYALDAQIRSINKHFERTGMKAKAEFLDRKLYIIKVDYEIPKNFKVSIVIDNIESQLNSRQIENKIQDYHFKSYKVEWLILQDKDIDINFKNTAIKTVAIDNKEEKYKFIAEECRGDSIVVINATIQINESSIHELIQWTLNENIGFVGPKFLTTDDTIDFMGINHDDYYKPLSFEKLPNLTYNEWGYTEWYRNYDALSERCFAIRKDYLKQIIKEEQDYEGLCKEVLLDGKRNLYNPLAIAYK